MNNQKRKMSVLNLYDQFSWSLLNMKSCLRFVWSKNEQERKNESTKKDEVRTLWNANFSNRRNRTTSDTKIKKSWKFVFNDWKETSIVVQCINLKRIVFKKGKNAAQSSECTKIQITMFVEFIFFRHTIKRMVLTFQYDQRA